MTPLLSGSVGDLVCCGGNAVSLTSGNDKRWNNKVGGNHVNKHEGNWGTRKKSQAG